MNGKVSEDGEWAAVAGVLFLSAIPLNLRCVRRRCGSYALVLTCGSLQCRTCLK